MQRYINQLIEDLQEAKNNARPAPELSDKECFELQIKWRESGNLPEFWPKQLYGVSYEELPPTEKLNEAQMQQLIDAIKDTWSAFDIGLAFPDEAPVAFRYELLRYVFSRKVFYMPGMPYIEDFCIFWCPECKIVDYCKIKDGVWTAEELEAERKSPDSIGKTLR